MFIAKGCLPLNLNLFMFCLRSSSRDCLTLFPQRKGGISSMSHFVRVCHEVGKKEHGREQ